MSTAAASNSKPPRTDTARPGLVTVLVPVLASTVLTLGTVAGAVTYLLRHGKLGAVAAGSVALAPAPVVLMQPPASHVVALDPMIVNLSDADGHSYLRASVSLRIKDVLVPDTKKEEKKEGKSSDPATTELRDTTLAVLSRQTSAALLTPEGREALKRELQDAIRKNNEIPVLDVLFTDFLVQRG